MGAPVTSVKILNGQTTSSNIPLGNLALVGISCPTITAASLGVAVSSDGGQTFQTMAIDSTVTGTAGPYLILPAASTGNVYVTLNPEYFLGVDTIQLVSSASQGADRTFNLHLREKR